MRPLVFPLISFVSGLAAARNFNLSPRTVFLLLALSFLFFALTLARKRPSIASSLPLFFSIGALFILPYTRPFIPERHIMNQIEKSGLGTRFEAEVLGPLLEYDGKTYLLVAAKKVFHGNEARPAAGRVRLSVKGGPPDVRTGDIVAVLARLREAKNLGNPGEFDLKWHYLTEDVHVLGSVESPMLMVKVGDGGYGLYQGMEGLRQRLSGFIEKNSSSPLSASILKALLIGERSHIPSDVGSAFSATGTSHILSISGLHMGMVAYSAYRLFFLALGLSEGLTLAVNIRKTALLLSLAPLFFYAVLAGFFIPAQRSALMVAAFVVVYVFDRGKDFFNTLSLAALVVLALSPASLWAPSFLLSFAAVLSMALLVPGLKEMFEAGRPADAKKKGSRPVVGQIIGFLRKNLLVSIAATLGTAPIVAYFFNTVSVYGFLANLLVVPLMGFVAVVAGLASMAMLLFSETLASFILKTADLSVVAGVFCVKAFARLPLSSLRVSTPTMVETALFYVLVMAVFNLGQRRVLASIAIALSLSGLAADSAIRRYHARNNDDLRVTFLSVGQGDSMLVEFPGNRTMLIDGGPAMGDFDAGERVVAPFLWKKKIPTLDYVVLSHAQRDHMAGLEFILDNFRVSELWWNGVGELKGLSEAIKRRDTKVSVMDSESPARAINGVRMEVLGPARDAGYDVNDSSLVLRMSYGEREFLFTGDMGFKPEARLLARDMGADVLKVPHHGSRTSSSPDFIRAVKPRIAVVSVGRGNAFGLPHPDTMERLASSGARVFRTDVDGAVVVSTDGKDLEVGTHSP